MVRRRVVRLTVSRETIAASLRMLPILLKVSVRKDDLGEQDRTSRPARLRLRRNLPDSKPLIHELRAAT
ncbi:MAG: hypothetical protein DWQ34_12435 [Planctomycetota bacterium]|nr:MAG: hypothetical protein DWQ29_18920 [Planctomycetota bacterium]REJ92613.1 MAG: hypothetical protein DWQ34_12435 [Planctomycetota bacterium]REK28314.1 MAG: hypothetical protein DWQ45_24960 [Planctomycetota bacterium]